MSAITISRLISRGSSSETNNQERPVDPRENMCAFFISKDGKEQYRGIVNSLNGNNMNVSIFDVQSFGKTPLQNCDLIISDWNVFEDKEQ